MGAAAESSKELVNVTGVPLSVIRADPDSLLALAGKRVVDEVIRENYQVQDQAAAFEGN